MTNLIFTFVGLWLIDRLGRRTLLYIGSAGYILSLGVCAIAFFSFSEFKVVSASIDTITGAEQVMRIERGEGYFSAADKQRAAADYAAARKALADAAASERYKGAKILLPEQLPPAEVKAAAELSKTEASKLLGASSYIVLVCMIVFIAAHAVGSGTIIWVFISEIFPNDQRAAGQALGSFTHWIFAALLTPGLPDRDQGVRRGLHVRLFLRDDDPAADLGENHDAGDEGAVARADRKAARPGERSVNAGGRTVFRASGHSGSGNAAHRWRSRSTQPFGLKRTPSRSSNARCSGQPGAVRPAWFTTRWHGSPRPAGTRETAGRPCANGAGWPVKNAICP